MSRAPLTAVAAALGLLAMPAVASAASYTVDPLVPDAGACDAKNVCKTVRQALNAATSAGDEVVLKDGTYVEDLPPILVPNLTIRAEHAGKAKIQGTKTTAGANVLRVGQYAAASLTDLSGTTPTGEGGGFTLKGVVVDVQDNGGSALLVRAPNVSVEDSTLSRNGAATDNAADKPVVVYDGALSKLASPGTLSFTRSFVVQGAGTQGAIEQTSPATAAPAGGLALTDTLVFSDKGPAVALRSSAASDTPSTIVRSQLIATEGGATALDILSMSSDPTRKQVRVDSSVLSGAKDGIGLHATSSASGSNATAGAITIRGVHVTIAGAAKGVVLDALADGPGTITGGGTAKPAGSISASFDGSIVHGANSIAHFTGNGTTSATNSVALDIVNSDTPQTAEGGVTVAGNSNTPDDKLFVDPAKRNFHLRAAAPNVIDAFRAPASGESEKDFEGQPRVSGAKADRGADEFVNTAPTPAFTTDLTVAGQGQAVTFDASGTADPDAGDVTAYLWDFGDGTTLKTTDPRTAHVYSARGSFTPVLVVVDAAGATGGPLSGTPISVVDPALTAFGVAITSPKNGATLRRYRTRTTKAKVKLKGRTKEGKARFKTVTRKRKVSVTQRFTGTAGAAAVRVDLALMRGTAAARNGQCAFLRADRKFVGRPCGKPVPIPLTVKNGRWAFKLKTTSKFRAGKYTLFVRAFNAGGAASPVSAITFTLR